MVALVVPVAEVVALVHQDKVSIAKPLVVQHPLGAVLLILAEESHGEDTGVELVGLVIVLPHLHQRRRADDQRPGSLAALELFDDGGADVGLAEPDDVGDKTAAIAPDHLHRLAHGLLLKLGQHRRDVVAPQEAGRLGALQLVTDQLIQGFQVYFVGRDLGQGPRLAQLVHQVRLKVLGLGPKVLEPEGQLGVVGVAVDHDVELCIGGDTRQSEVA